MQRMKIVSPTPCSFYFKTFSLCPPPLPTKAFLTTALNNLATGITAVGGGGVHIPIHDLFGSNSAFDLTTRVGTEALQEARSPITPKWDGTVKEFPTFVVNIELCSITEKNGMQLVI